MDFKDTQEQAKYRAECRDWLEDNAEIKENKYGRNVDSPIDDNLKVATEWQQKKYDAG